MPPPTSESAVQARAFRRLATPAERALWALVRARKVDGAKFRRQHPVGPYYADFACIDAGLILEADGADHFPPSPHQIARDAFLRARGFEVLRFENWEILQEPGRTLQRVRQALRERTPPLPAPEGGQE